MTFTMVVILWIRSIVTYSTHDNNNRGKITIPLTPSSTIPRTGPSVSMVQPLSSKLESLDYHNEYFL